MSDSQAYEEVMAASDGVTVTKRFEEDDFPVPAIAFNIVSNRTEAVTIRLVDSVPEDVAVEDLGFHPEYGSEFWDINDDQIAFEKELEPEADYTTVYGIRATGTDDIEKFLTQPTLESVDPPYDGDDDDIVGSTDNAIKDVISGESDSIPGLEDEDEESEEDIETLDLKDPNSDGSEVEGEAGGDGDEQTPEVAIENGNVIGAMAAEIRQNNVSADDVKMLKRALDAVSDDGSSESDGANTARIQRIQADIADLRAYTDALEEFLDENGTGDEMIEEFSERLNSFEAELDSFESDIQTAKSAAQDASNEVDDVSGEVSEMHGEIDDVEESLDELSQSLESVEDDIEEVRDELGDGEIDDRLENVESNIEELNDWREQLSSVIGGGD